MSDIDDAQPRADVIKAEFEAAQRLAGSIAQETHSARVAQLLGRITSAAATSRNMKSTPVVSAEELLQLTERLTTYPADFHIHPKVKKLLEQRAEMGAGKRPVDYGMAEALAFGSLVKTGVPVRLSGQDSRRGTFNQRHSVLLDIENEQEYVPLQHIADDAGALREFTTRRLSEAGVLGFEYGYSRDYPEALVLWEAQFGDFANVAQAVIDQFISAGEDKWGLLSGVVLLLPHGYEGQGPEHSSARIERFLQLAARDNFQICQPSNCGSIFPSAATAGASAMAQAAGSVHPEEHVAPSRCVVADRRFYRRRFLRGVARTAEVGDAKRILLCTGKIGHELRAERKKTKGCHHRDRLCGAALSVSRKPN